MSDDATLVTRAQAGDFAAFEQLVSRYEQRMYTLAMHVLHQHEDAEDVVQTAFLSALEHLGELRQPAAFAAWLTRIAVNTALKVLRKRQGLDAVSLEAVTAEDEEGAIPHPQYIADWRDDPSQTVEQRELQRLLAAAIAALPEKQRVVFVLRDVAGMSVEETAQALGLSPANVKVRLLRARLVLREHLTRLFGDERRRLVPPRHAGDAPRATPAAQRLPRNQEG
ncbi:MAG: RNA polymerase sigma factor [Candidatus Tectimicrobiota bacterium]|nr:MAG: RNA polymerase sigma factor [Candidatus Tectomicrobia bacterium]